MSFLNTIIDSLFGVVFPLRCLSCGKTGSDFCFECVSTSPSAERESDEWIFPILDYRHPPVKKALKLFKYRSKKRLAAVFAELLYGRIMEEFSDLKPLENFNDPLLVPIPLAPKRRRERGYNQAELLCLELTKLDRNINFKLEKNILIKPKDTEHQARIENRSERLKNIAGSFTVKNPEAISKRNIILIDDILTTGATLSEARKMLKCSGARKVVAFTIAH
jgi:ComF family protein